MVVTPTSDVCLFFTPPLSGVCKYQPKLPSVSVYHFGITVGIFLLYNLAGTPFEDCVGTLFLKNWRELLFSSTAIGKSTPVHVLLVYCVTNHVTTSSCVIGVLCYKSSDECDVQKTNARLPK